MDPPRYRACRGPGTLETVTLIGGLAWSAMPLRASMRDAMAASAGGENWLKSCSAEAGTALNCSLATAVARVMPRRPSAGSASWGARLTTMPDPWLEYGSVSLPVRIDTGDMASNGP